jgi:hypothetical protein
MLQKVHVAYLCTFQFQTSQWLEWVARNPVVDPRKARAGICFVASVCWSTKSKVVGYKYLRQSPAGTIDTTYSCLYKSVYNAKKMSGTETTTGIRSVKVARENVSSIKKFTKYSERGYSALKAL